MYVQRPRPIRIVSRPKVVGLGEHWGVQLPDGSVAHRTPRGDELVSFDQFAQGRQVREVKRAKPERCQQTLWRVNASINQRTQYRLADSNCEHYANWLIGEEPASPQVQVVVLLAGIAALMHFASA